MLVHHLPSRGQTPACNRVSGVSKRRNWSHYPHSTPQVTSHSLASSIPKSLLWSSGHTHAFPSRFHKFLCPLPLQASLF